MMISGRAMTAAGFLVILLAVLSASCSLNSNYSPRGYAVIYGVTQYNYINNLTATRPDAESMAGLFEDQGYTVLLRIDNDNGVPASRDQLEADIASISQTITPSDNFVFYFSGHGGRYYDLYGSYSDPPGNESSRSDSDDEWIFLYGSLYSMDFADFSKTAISDDKLNAMIAAIPTNRKLIVIDACNSGGFIGTSADIDMTPPNYVNDPAFDTFTAENQLSGSITLYFGYPDINRTDIPWNNAVVLGASGEQEYSWENSALGHGVFTYYFLQSPGNADKNKDGLITADEIYAYTKKQIIVNWDRQTYPEENFHPRISGGPVTFAVLQSLN